MNIEGSSFLFLHNNPFFLVSNPMVPINVHCTQLIKKHKNSQLRRSSSCLVCYLKEKRKVARLAVLQGFWLNVSPIHRTITLYTEPTPTMQIISSQSLSFLFFFSSLFLFLFFATLTIWFSFVVDTRLCFFFFFFFFSCSEGRSEWGLMMKLLLVDLSL